VAEPAAVGPFVHGDLWIEAYRELRALAVCYLESERPGHTLQPTALVNEAWLRLSRERKGAVDHSGFLRAAAVAMRRILVDHARARTRDKRTPAGGIPVALHEDIASAPVPTEVVLEVDEHLRVLAEISARRADVVHLRFFGGLTEVQTAEALGVSRRTVQEEFRSARAWLAVRLTRTSRAALGER
jgi:RNA polymerase sigma factor (TIGR02999 family)